MTKRRFIFFLVLALILAGLAYLQVRQWRRFDWDTFWSQTEAVQEHWWLILGAIVCIYVADALRAFRWALFLRPVKKVNPFTLVAPQFIGFTGLALLGRPGELIRPFIIAKRCGLSMASQVGVWTVERLFDISAVIVILGFDLFLSPELRQLHDYRVVRNAGVVVILIVAMGILVAALLTRYGAPISAWIERRLSRRFPATASTICARISSFSQGLNTIDGLRSFLGLTLMSLVIWVMVGGSYRLVTLAYNAPLSDLVYSEVVLLMFASIAGGALQLPGVGGGSQIATIATLYSVFGIEKELATSCGILLWLVTFMSVAPLGLILAHREHLSLRGLVKEEEAEVARAGTRA